MKDVIQVILPLLCKNKRLFWITYREKISKCHHFVPKGHLEVCSIIKENECLCSI